MSRGKRGTMHVPDFEAAAFLMRMARLSRNIEIGAGLCFAHGVALFYGCNGAWWPGCGRAPGGRDYVETKR